MVNAPWPACREPGEYLLIEDTTFAGLFAASGHHRLGIIGDGGRGLCLHSTLAMKVMAWDLTQKPEAVVVAYWASNVGRKPRARPVKPEVPGCGETTEVPSGGPKCSRRCPCRRRAAPGPLWPTGKPTSMNRFSAAATGRGFCDPRLPEPAAGGRSGATLGSVATGNGAGDGGVGDRARPGGGPTGAGSIKLHTACFSGPWRPAAGRKI